MRGNTLLACILRLTQVLQAFFIEKDKKWMWGVKKAGETAGAGGGFMDLRCDRDSERKQHC